MRLTEVVGDDRDELIPVGVDEGECLSRLGLGDRDLGDAGAGLEGRGGGLLCQVDGVIDPARLVGIVTAARRRHQCHGDRRCHESPDHLPPPGGSPRA